MGRYKTYIVYRRPDNRVVIEEFLYNIPERELCRDVFDAVESYLLSKGFKLVYYSKHDHHEKVLKRGADEIILIYSECIVKTNIGYETFKKYVVEAVRRKNLEPSYHV